MEPSTFGENITELLKTIDGYVWGIPLILLILLTGIYDTCPGYTSPPSRKGSKVYVYE